MFLGESVDDFARFLTFRDHKSPQYLTVGTFNLIVVENGGSPLALGCLACVLKNSLLNVNTKIVQATKVEDLVCRFLIIPDFNFSNDLTIRRDGRRSILEVATAGERGGKASENENDGKEEHEVGGGACLADNDLN